MKQIIAVVKPYLAEKVLDALKLAPVEACGVCEVKGYGRQKNYLDEYRGSEYSMAYLPKVEIALWVDDPRVEEVVRTIVDVARPYIAGGLAPDIHRSKHGELTVCATNPQPVAGEKC